MSTYEKMLLYFGFDNFLGGGGYAMDFSVNSFRDSLTIKPKF